MTRRFRLLAGPNGSGKTTLKAYAAASSYDESVKDFFRGGRVVRLKGGDR